MTKFLDYNGLKKLVDGIKNKYVQYVKKESHLMMGGG